METKIESVAALVERMESDFTDGTTRISKHVSHSMKDTLDTIDAYLNSTHISGKFDALGREKPFFNIVVAAVNIWYRATDIDRRHVRLRATNSDNWINSFLFNVQLQKWMREAGYGRFLNEWGYLLARSGSDVVKFVRNKDGLFIEALPWNRDIVDSVNFDAVPVIELIELSEAQLRRRVDTHGYNKEQVEALITAAASRELPDGQDKDNKDGFYKLYEVHGELPLALVTDKPEDVEYVQQMHVVSLVGSQDDKGETEYESFTLVRGREERHPYMITHLIEEQDRTLSRGAVENLFEAQWMVNHTMKNMKDQLDFASRMVMQTADENYVGVNVLSNIETGDILKHAPNAPLTQLNNTSHDTASLQNYAVQWKQLGNEINGISDAMLGAQPKSGTAWRQTEAMLTESHSLFELMTENKGHYIEKMMREWIIPYIKETLLDNPDEIAATLEAHDIERIDALYLKNKAIKKTNSKMFDQLFAAALGTGPLPTQEDQQGMIEQEQQQMQQELQPLANERFFRPDELGVKTWREQFENVEDDLEVDVTGEQRNVQQMLTTLDTTLKTILNPGFEQNKRAQATVGRILELTGAMSPIEYASIPSSQLSGGSSVPEFGGKEKIESQRNIKQS